MKNLSPQDAETVRGMPDTTISQRLDEIERALKFDPDASYRRQLIREYLDLTTDPEEIEMTLVWHDDGNFYWTYLG